MNLSVMHSCRLPWRADIGAALAQCLALPADSWTTHFNAGYHNGLWEASALRCSTTSPVDVAPGEGPVESFVDTPLLTALSEIQTLLAPLSCPLKSVRLMRLRPGGVIQEHRDSHVGLAYGEARLHLPLQTEAAVCFYVDQERVPLRAGEWWYVDVSQPHRVSHHGATDRIHLVVDCVVNPWLAEQLAQGDSGIPYPPETDPQVAFNAFREHVFRHDGLQSTLLATTQPNAFDEQVVTLGRQHGFHFSTEEVRAARNLGRRQWIEQWIV